MGPSTEGEEPEVQEQIQVRQPRTTWRIVPPVGEASLFSRQSVGLERGTDYRDQSEPDGSRARGAGAYAALLAEGLRRYA